MKEFRLKCDECGKFLGQIPIGMNSKDYFIFNMGCPDHGPQKILQSTFVYMNWEFNYINKRTYKSFDKYLEKISTCQVDCIECPLVKKCYKSAFFYDVDKEFLRVELSEKD